MRHCRPGVAGLAMHVGKPVDTGQPPGAQVGLIAWYPSYVHSNV